MSLNINIDSVIFIGFLFANVVIGLFASRGIKTIKEYAVGERNFSTATIVATLVATWISGSFFFMHAAEVYKGGFLYLFAAIGDILCLLVVGLVFAPRLQEFLGKLSIAEAMGSLYGEKVRVVTAISGVIGVAGIIAVQLRISGLTFEYALGVPAIYGILSAGIVIALYASLGGIKSVTFTDIIQFFTFSIVIPMIAYILLQSIDSSSNITNILSTNPLFDYENVFNFSHPKQLHYLSLFLFLAIPAFNPAIFQRIAMAKNTKQIRHSFIIASIVCFFLLLIISWISILMLSLNPNLNPNEIIKHIIFDYTSDGMRGLILVGIMAMIMSTADSYINSTSVIVVHDFCKPLGIKIFLNELSSARIVSLLIAVLAIALSLIKTDLIGLIVLVNSFYMPVVSVPFIAALFGYRSTEMPVLLGMGAGLITVLIWNIFEITLIDSVPPAMLANLFVLAGSHLLLKQPGGWVGIEDPAPLIAIRRKRKENLRKFWHKIKIFNTSNILHIFENNRPKGDGLISVLGAFVMISSFGSVNIISTDTKLEFAKLLNYLYPFTLCASTILISYPLWLQSWKETKLFAITWNIIMFFVLICFSFLMVLVSNFSEIQLMIFMVNVILISSLISWQWSLFSIIFGTTITTYFYENFFVMYQTQTEVSSVQFKVISLLLMISSTLVIFLKPKQDRYELTEEKVEHLAGRIGSQEKQLREALALKGEFIRNVNHEYHAPMIGVVSMAQVLAESYDGLSDEQRREAADAIYKSSVRLESFDANITSLSKLSKASYDLKLELFDLSSLLHERMEVCRKLYEENSQDRDYILDISEGIAINADKYYITQLLDNLIINAITYCSKGKISIILKRDSKGIMFSIRDEGVGIPSGELLAIFDEFTVSSKTRTPAGGRGVGLALCKKVIEVHGGSIKAESDGVKGAQITFHILR